MTKDEFFRSIYEDLIEGEICGLLESISLLMKRPRQHDRSHHPTLALWTLQRQNDAHRGAQTLNRENCRQDFRHRQRRNQRARHTRRTYGKRRRLQVALWKSVRGRRVDRPEKQSKYNLTIQKIPIQNYEKQKIRSLESGFLLLLQKMSKNSLHF